MAKITALNLGKMGALKLRVKEGSLICPQGTMQFPNILKNGLGLTNLEILGKKLFLKQVKPYKPPTKKENPMTKTQIKKKIAERIVTLKRLEENANQAGTCWASQKLGFTEGYISALEEILGKGQPNWDFLAR